jgi:DNA-binding response OmpR family regulator
MVTRGRSAEAGVTYYFKKPVDMNVLGDRVRQVVEQQQELVKSRLTGEKSERD